MSNSDFSLISMIIKVIFGFIIYRALFFVPAGSFEWIEAWVFLLLSFGYVLVVVFYFSQRDPTILVSRSKIKTEKSFDTVFLLFAGISFFLMFLLSAMDFRSGISDTTFIGIKIFGFSLIIIAYIIIFIVMKENAFASKTIRVQEGQKVITTGPYAFVRHPMYSGFCFMCIGFPLAFGSILSLPFGVISILLMAIRSVYEEKALIKDLPGYQDYMQSVKNRLIPKIW